MTKVKLCGLTRQEDIAAVNEWKPDFCGFVFARKSSRYVNPEQASALKQHLDPAIKAVGVFVDEEVETVASLLNENIIDMAQLHGREDNRYIDELRAKTSKPIIKAYKVKGVEQIQDANESKADFVLLDSGAGSGLTFDWSCVNGITRPYFLAGGLSPENVSKAVAILHPYAVDVSSGIETEGKKDKEKIKDFVMEVRKEG